MRTLAFAVFGLSAIRRARRGAAAAPPRRSRTCAASTRSIRWASTRPQPRLGWQLRSAGARRRAARLPGPGGARRRGAASGRTLWDTGQVASDAPGPGALRGPRARVVAALLLARPRLGRRAAGPSAWSAPASVGDGAPAAGRLEGALDRGRLGRGHEGVAARRRCCGGRSRLKGAPRSARAYVTSLGLYELEINGQRVGDQLFTPGWTSYRKRLQYQTYDVTALLRAGDNAIGATLGDGWYRGFLAWQTTGATSTATASRCCASSGSSTRDGRVETVGTDETWKAATGPIRASDIYRARPTTRGWSGPAGAPRATTTRDWTPVRVAEPATRDARRTRRARRCAGSRRSGR